MNDELLQISDATDRYPGNHPVEVTAIHLNERRLLSTFERCKNGRKVGGSGQGLPLRLGTTPPLFIVPALPF
jgi:hypothetical protein